MADFAALWQSALRKEAMDILRTLWPALDEAGRNRLGAAIVAGPPEALIARIDAEDRASSRDRRIFDRIIVIERVGEPPLTAGLNEELARIRGLYPAWRSLPGEQAHFGSWMESRRGPDTLWGVDDLSGLDNGALIDLLTSENDRREGLLDAWRQLAAGDGNRALTVLETLAARDVEARADIWRHGLSGLRENAKGGFARRMVTLLGHVPDALFAQPDFSQAAAEIVQAISGAINETELGSAFWTLFDRTLEAASEDPSNVAKEGQRDWVGFAINCSMGYLAQGFFTALFGRGLKVGAGVPADLRKRFDSLMRPELIAHRPARVIAASRLSYLYAIDPTWVGETLLPGLTWTDEEESLALWQGFGWQVRVDPQLWSVIKPSLLDLFTPERLGRLGGFRRNLAQLLMLAGVEFGIEELPRDRVRAAIRAMPDDMRDAAASWISSYLQQGLGDDEAEGDDARDPDVDVLWRQRVGPWIKRIWPPDPAIRSRGVSQQLAIAAIATDDAFPEAVALIAPLLIQVDGIYVLHRLAESEHPERHPRATVSLVDKLIQPDALIFGRQELRNILNRVSESAAELAEDAAFRRWDERLRLLDG